MTTNISSPRDSETKQASPRDPTPESMKYLWMGDNFCLYFLMGGEGIWLEMLPLPSSLFRNNSTHNCNCRTPYVSFPQRLFRESIRFVHFYGSLGSLFQFVHRDSVDQKIMAHVKNLKTFGSRDLRLPKGCCGGFFVWREFHQRGTFECSNLWLYWKAALGLFITLQRFGTSSATAKNGKGGT